MRVQAIEGYTTGPLIKSQFSNSAKSKVKVYKIVKFIQKEYVVVSGGSAQKCTKPNFYYARRYTKNSIRAFENNTEV